MTFERIFESLGAIRRRYWGCPVAVAVVESPGVAALVAIVAVVDATVAVA